MSNLASVGTANPSFSINQQTMAALVDEHYGDTLRPRSLEVMRKVLEHPSIRKRYIAVDNIAELITFKNEDPDKRMKRFTRWGTRLGAEAADEALRKAGVARDEVTVLVVNTCTGYLCPGLTSYLIEHLGLRKDIKAFDVVGLGCGGSVPNINLAQSVLGNGNGGVALSIAVEVCSATYQMDNDISLIISNAIFGDGAAAVCIWNRPQGLEMVASRSYYEPAHRDDVRYVYRKGQLHNRLSPQLPQIIGTLVPEEIKKLCSEHSLSPSDINHWAIHPGGHKMLEEIKAALDLPEHKMALSRKVLAEYGNMSSPSVIFVLNEIMQNGVSPGDWCYIIGYGAGLSIYSYLLRAR